MGKFVDISGEKFGRLLVLHRAENRGGITCWNCKCVCGKTVEVAGADLKRGRTRSCGCLRSDITTKRNTTHNSSYTRLYNIFVGMNRRCKNTRDSAYPRYGGKGIKNMFASFVDFRDWALSNGYSDHLTIDRMDNNGDYCEDNCRWATYEEQNRNKSSNIHVTHPETGEKLTLSEWGERLGGSKSMVRQRIQSGWDAKKAITTPKVQ